MYLPEGFFIPAMLVVFDGKNDSSEKTLGEFKQ
jgi:hypothetical protein